MMLLSYFTGKKHSRQKVVKHTVDVCHDMSMMSKMYTSDLHKNYQLSFNDTTYYLCLVGWTSHV